MRALYLRCICKYFFKNTVLRSCTSVHILLYNFIGLKNTEAIFERAINGAMLMHIHLCLEMSVSLRSIICLSLRLRQIIDLLATDKSRYFAITEFNNCFIIESPFF